MEKVGKRSEGQGLLLVLLIVLLGTFRILFLPYSPEDWFTLSLLDERSLGEAFLPVEGYPYFRPLWYAYLKLCRIFQLSGGMAHLGVLLAHLGTVYLVHRTAKGLGASSSTARLMALFAGLAPGTASALSWLPAGNKAFVLCAMALSACWIVEAWESRRFWLGMPFFALLPLACAENGYASVLLLPLIAFLAWRRRKGSRGGRVPLLFLLPLLLSLLHLSLLPPGPDHDPPGTSRVRELLDSMSGDPLSWAFEVLENLGRYFAHGLGLGRNLPLAGLMVLLLSALPGLRFLLAKRGDGRLGLAVLLFLLLNVPASLFPGESGSHHAYLPAVGAGLVLASLMSRMPGRARSPILVVGVLGFLLQGFQGQEPWRRYLLQADRVLQSSREVLPEAPAGKPPLFLNLPAEYKAAFRLRFGGELEPESWPVYCILTTRRAWVPPVGIPLPETGEVLEYDGTRLQRTSFEEVWSRRRVEEPWFLQGLEPHPDRVLAWGRILRSDRDLLELPWTLGDPGERGEVDPGRSVRLLEQGFLEKGFFWELHVSTARRAWLVLPWSPVGLPCTERALIFHLEPLPWAFGVEVFDLEAGMARLAPDTRSLLGLLPALFLPPMEKKIRVELKLR